MLEYVPQEALALILPMGIAFFLGLIMVSLTVVFLLKDKGFHPALGLASLGLPAAVGTGFGIVGSREAEDWVYIASLAPVVGLLLAIGLFGLLALPLAWRGARVQPKDWRASCVVWALTFGLCFCLYMQAQVQYTNLLPIAPDHASPNMVSYFRMVILSMGGGLLGLMCLGKPSQESHWQLRLVGGSALALLVWVGEAAHTSILDYMSLNNLATKVVERGVDVHGAVAGSYGVYEGEAIWTAGALGCGTLVWVYLILSARRSQQGTLTSALMSGVWFVLPVLSVVGDPVEQADVGAEVVKQVEEMQSAVDRAGVAVEQEVPAPPGEPAEEGQEAP